MIVDSIPQVRRVLDFYKKSAADSTPTDSSADSTVDSATDSDGAESTWSPLNLKVRRESIGILVCWLSKKSDMTSVGLLAGDLNCPPQTPSSISLKFKFESAADSASWTWVKFDQFAVES